MGDFTIHKREDIGTGKEVFSFKCKAIRIGQHKFEAKERVVVSDKGIKLIAPGVKSKDQGCSVLHIQTHEIVKVLINTKTNHGVLFLFVLPSCGAYLRENLEMSSQSDGKSLAFNPLSRDCSVKHIVFHLACEGDTVLGAFKKALLTVEEIAAKDVTELIKRIEKEPPRTPVSASNDGKQILVYPQGKGGIPIYIDDYLCLAIDQYLNDVIIDFYLKFLMAEKLTEEQREKTHVFSTFFYKRLTTLERTRQKFMDKDLKLTAAKKRHLRVKNWTKNVDLFKKDFIIIPINEQSHWFLAIVCFPHLKGPVTVEGNRPVKTALAKRIKKASTKNKMLVQIGNTTITPVKKEDLINVAGDESERDEAEGDDSEFNSEDSGEEDTSDPESQPIKQPCILIFDSLAGTSRTRVTATIRDYLTCEFASKTDGEGPVFNRDNLPGHYVKVPQQNNFTDCGLYLLQYVEQFFLDPIKDYRLPLKGLVNWFESLEATKKREDIANLLNDLIKKYQPNNLPLPELEFPTIGGKLIETDEVGDFDEGAETDHFEDSEWTMDESGRQVTTTPQQVKITRQIKFQKRTSDDKLIYKIPLKQARLEESSSST